MILSNALRLWVMARMTSNAERICREVKLGSVVEDPSSPYYGKMPVPRLIVAQFEIICTVVMQRPLMKLILNSLQTLIKANRKTYYWFTIYLTLFVLLHSCSMTTRRDGEYARQMLMNVGLPIPVAYQSLSTNSYRHLSQTLTVLQNTILASWQC